MACRFVFYTACMSSFSPNSMGLGLWYFLFFIFFTAFGRLLTYIIIIYLLQYYYSKTHEFIFRIFLTNTSLSYRKRHRGPPTLTASCLRGTSFYRVCVCMCVCIDLLFPSPHFVSFFSCEYNNIMGFSSCVGVILNRNYLCTTSHEI